MAEPSIAFAAQRVGHYVGRAFVAGGTLGMLATSHAGSETMIDHASDPSLLRVCH